MDDVLKSIFDGINNSVNSLNDKIKNTEGTVNVGLDDFAKKMIPNEKDLPETFLVGAVGCILPAAKIIDKAVKMQNNPNEKITTKDEKFGRKLVKLPVPEFYVFYNGKDDYPTESIMKLSDAFMQLDGKLKNQFENANYPLEISVKVININDFLCRFS